MGISEKRTEHREYFLCSWRFKTMAYSAWNDKKARWNQRNWTGPSLLKCYSFWSTSWVTQKDRNCRAGWLEFIRFTRTGNDRNNKRAEWSGKWSELWSGSCVNRSPVLPAIWEKQLKICRGTSWFLAWWITERNWSGKIRSWKIFFRKWRLEHSKRQHLQCEPIVKRRQSSVYLSRRFQRLCSLRAFPLPNVPGAAPAGRAAYEPNRTFWQTSGKQLFEYALAGAKAFSKNFELLKRWSVKRTSGRFFPNSNCNVRKWSQLRRTEHTRYAQGVWSGTWYCFWLQHGRNLHAVWTGCMGKYVQHEPCSEYFQPLQRQTGRVNECRAWSLES